MKLIRSKCEFWLEPSEANYPGGIPMFHLEAKNLWGESVKNVQFMMDAITESGLLYAFASSDFWKRGDVIESGGELIIEVPSDHGPLKGIDYTKEPLIVRFEISYLTFTEEFTRIAIEKIYQFSELI